MSRVIAFIGGVFPIAIGYVFAPSPKHDPENWGFCGLGSVFPVVTPFKLTEGQYCLDCYECVYEPSRVAFSVIVLGGLFLLSGVFAARIAKTHSILGATIPAGVSVALLLVVMADDRAFLILPTLVLGFSVWLSSIALSAAGAFLATRDV